MTTASRQEEGAVAARGRSRAVLRAIAAVPRSTFPGESGLGAEATPEAIARFLENLGLAPDAKVLVVGAGTGYLAAVLSHLVAQVRLLVEDTNVAATAREALAQTGRRNVAVATGSLERGLGSEGPFAAIVVLALLPHVPEVLLEQLAPGG